MLTAMDHGPPNGGPPAKLPPQPETRGFHKALLRDQWWLIITPLKKPLFLVGELAMIGLGSPTIPMEPTSERKEMDFKICCC